MFVFAVVWLENNFICLCKGGWGGIKQSRDHFPPTTAVHLLSDSPLLGLLLAAQVLLHWKFKPVKIFPVFRFTLFTALFRSVFLPFGVWNSTFSKGWMLLFLSLVRRTSSVEGRGEGKEGGGESISEERLQTREILLTSIHFPAGSPSRAFTELQRPLQFTAAFTCNVSLWELRYNCTPGQ